MALGNSPVHDVQHGGSEGFRQCIHADRLGQLLVGAGAAGGLIGVHGAEFIG